MKIVHCGIFLTQKNSWILIFLIAEISQGRNSLKLHEIPHMGFVSTWGETFTRDPQPLQKMVSVIHLLIASGLGFFLYSALKMCSKMEYIDIITTAVYNKDRSLQFQKRNISSAGKKSGITSPESTFYFQLPTSDCAFPIWFLGTLITRMILLGIISFLSKTRSSHSLGLFLFSLLLS